MQPRIYTYKITFEEVPYYYYGSKKEKYFNQEYWGSPVTNKWCWELYTPKKQILEIFDFTDEGYEECRIVENRLIKPVINDPWCLNENVGGIISLKVCRENGRRMKELGIGVHGRSKEEMIENGKRNGKKIKELGLGICALTPEQRSENGKKGGAKVKELNKGICALTLEQRVEIGKKSAKTNEENKTSIFAFTAQQLSENGKKGGAKAKELGLGFHTFTKEQRVEIGKESVKKINSQRWMCLETGYTSTAAGVVSYQKARGIDTAQRVRIE
jgi:hypothetical protein